MIWKPGVPLTGCKLWWTALKNNIEECSQIHGSKIEKHLKVIVNGKTNEVGKMMLISPSCTVRSINFSIISSHIQVVWFLFFTQSLPTSFAAHASFYTVLILQKSLYCIAEKLLHHYVMLIWCCQGLWLTVGAISADNSVAF